MYRKNNSKKLSVEFLLVLFLKFDCIIESEASPLMITLNKEFNGAKKTVCQTEFSEGLAKRLYEVDKIEDLDYKVHGLEDKMNSYREKFSKVDAIEDKVNEALFSLKKENEKMREQIKMSNNFLYATILMIGIYGGWRVVYYFFFSDHNNQHQDKK